MTNQYLNPRTWSAADRAAGHRQLAQAWTAGCAGLFALVLSTCGAPSGPIISSFGATSNEITDGQKITITAVLSDASKGPVSSGVKGVLTDGASKTYGTFTTTMPGVFTFDISWADLDASKRIAFASEEIRTYSADFIDDNGNRVSSPFTLRLHCNGDSACEGHCVVLGGACPISKSLQCFAGQCGTGCVVGKVGVLDGNPNPANSCQVCNAAVSKSSFSNSAPYTTCAPGLACSPSAQCTIPFQKRISSRDEAIVNKIVAPNAQTRIAIANKNYSTPLITYSPSVGVPFTSTALANFQDLFVLDPTHVFRAANGGIDSSSDGGLTFMPLKTGSGTALSVWASSVNDIWYSYITPPRANVPILYHSTDGGATFGSVSNGMLSSTFMRQIWGTSATNIFFVPGSGSVYRSVDQGVTATSVSVGAPINMMWGSGPSDIYFVTDNGFYYSTNSGASATRVTPPLNSSYPNAPGRSVHGCAANDVFFATQYEVWHYDGTKMALLPTGTTGSSGNVDWQTVACFAPGKVVVGGQFIYSPGVVSPIVLESL